MKTASIIILATLTSLSAFAQDTKPAAAAQAAPVKVAAAAKVTYKDAKKECMKENASLKGKDLQTCIKGKQGK